MKKKCISMLLSAVMILSTMLVGCGSSEPAAVSQKDGGAPKEAVEVSKEEGNVDESSSEAAGEKVHLKWAVWDISLLPYWEDLAEEFTKVYPNIEVECVDFGSNDYSNVLATELSGKGTDFDVVTIKDVPSYATLVEKNVLLPLDEYIAADGVNLAQYSGVTDQVTVDGKLYELPFRSDFWAIFYNKDIFDAKGIPYPTNDMTWEEYDTLARTVADTTFGAEVYGAHYHTWSSTIQLLGILDGKHSILDKNYDFMIPFYDMVQKAEDDGICMKYSDITTEGLHYAAAFSNGNIAMVNMGSWFVTTLINNLKSGEYNAELCGNWGMVKYPHAAGVEAGTTLGAITGLSVVTESQKQDAAWEFVKWASGEEGAKVLASTGTFPAITNDEIMSSIASMEGFPQDEQTKEAMEVSQLYLEVPYGSGLSQINEIVGTYHTMIMNRECTVEDGVRMMNEEAAKIQ